jgi:hypothetical protein
MGGPEIEITRKEELLLRKIAGPSPGTAVLRKKQPALAQKELPCGGRKPLQRE